MKKYSGTSKKKYGSNGEEKEENKEYFRSVNRWNRTNGAPMISYAHKLTLFFL